MSKYSLTFEKKNISTTFLKVSFIKKKTFDTSTIISMIYNEPL